MVYKILKKTLIYTTLTAMVLSCTGCKKNKDTGKEKPVMTQAPIKEEEKEPELGKLAEHKDKNIEFGLNLLKNTYNIRQNSIIAPMSVQMALGLVLNGAKDATQGCIIDAMGMETVTYNEYLKNYLDSVESGASGGLKYSNTIWINNISGGVVVNANYENRIKQYLDGTVQYFAFNHLTKDAINSWIEDKTDGYINSLFTKTESSDVLYMANASTFNMNWENTYSSSSMSAGKFVNINRTIANVEYLNSVESLYIEDNSATGFIKNYAGGRYQFVAILPDSTTNVFKYLTTLTADDLNKLLSTVKNEQVKVSLPRFTGIKVQNMYYSLKSLGVDSIYSEMANHSNILKSGANVSLAGAIQKTRFEVGKTGSQGGSVETVGNIKTSEATREVILNRPFIYMVYDAYQCLPVYMGVQQIM